MTDATTAPTNRQIAERAGWRIVPAGHASGVDWVTIYDPQGNAVDGGAQFAERHKWADHRIDSALPAYRHDIAAALTLPLPPGYRFSLRCAPGETAVCYILNEVDAVVDGTGAPGDDPADVVSRAWWAFKAMEAER